MGKDNIIASNNTINIIDNITYKVVTGAENFKNNIYGVYIDKNAIRVQSAEYKSNEITIDLINTNSILNSNIYSIYVDNVNTIISSNTVSIKNGVIRGNIYSGYTSGSG